MLVRGLRTGGGGCCLHVIWIFLAGAPAVSALTLALVRVQGVNTELS